MAPSKHSSVERPRDWLFEALEPRLLLANGLVVTELNYNPHDPTPGELAQDPDLNNDDFEFIELGNTGTGPIDLTGVEIAIDGVLNFTAASGTTLAPGVCAVIVQDPTAFQMRYGTEVNVVGQYIDRLGNGVSLRSSSTFNTTTRAPGPAGPTARAAPWRSSTPPATTTTRRTGGPAGSTAARRAPPARGTR